MQSKTQKPNQTIKSTPHHSPDVEERVVDEVPMRDFSGPSEDMPADQRPDLTSRSKNGMTSAPSRVSTSASLDKGIFPRPLRYVRKELKSVYIPLPLCIDDKRRLVLTSPFSLSNNYR